MNTHFHLYDETFVCRGGLPEEPCLGLFVPQPPYVLWEGSVFWASAPWALGCEFGTGLWVTKQESRSGDVRLNSVLVFSAFESLPHPGLRPSLAPSAPFLPLANTLCCLLEEGKGWGVNTPGNSISWETLPHSPSP